MRGIYFGKVMLRNLGGVVESRDDSNFLRLLRGGRSLSLSLSLSLILLIIIIILEQQWLCCITPPFLLPSGRTTIESPIIICLCNITKEYYSTDVVFIFTHVVYDIGYR